ncbi:MAG: hypothetical protein LBQ82_02510 [Treponema sp.]|jgi:hypothetical protein|nr:hypothetical protein [Treponema sp.]
MKTKKSGVFAALTVVLLIAAALIASCVDPETLNGSSASSNGNTGNFVPPDGKGYVKLSLGGSNGRTIMPAAGDIANSAYTGGFAIRGYVTDTSTTTLTFTPAPSGTRYTLTELQAAAATVVVNTNYTIEVDAYIGAVLTTSGKATFTAAAGSNPVNITLRPVITTGGTGTFEWNLTYGGVASFGDLTTATLEVNTPTPISINLTASGGNTGTWAAAVPTGVYNLTLTLERTDIGPPVVSYVPLVYTDVVHIYNTLTTSFGIPETPGATAEDPPLIPGVPKNFAALTLVPTYTVTFNGTTGNGTGTARAVAYLHGQVVTDADDYTDSPSLPITEDPDSTSPNAFLGWYTISGGLGVHFPLTNKVFNTRSLYGKWYTATQASPGTITFALPTDPASTTTLGGLTISAAKLNIDEEDLEAEPPVLNTYTVTATLPEGFSNVKYQVGTHAAASSLVIGYARNGGTPDIDNLLVLNNILAITVTATFGGQTYSFVALVTIGP